MRRSISAERRSAAASDPETVPEIPG
jgi:hypothetical protein